MLDLRLATLMHADWIAKLQFTFKIPSFVCRQRNVDCVFSFTYVELMNWAFWPTTKIPLDTGTIMISGPNGSGKTTFLDALRTLLRVPRLSSSRRAGDYLSPDVKTAVVKAVVTNTTSHAEERRPFESKGITSDLVTLVVQLTRKGGRWERRFLILANDVPLDNLRRMPKSDFMTPEAYSHVLRSAGFTDALLKVLALEQGQTDKLCEKSPRELMDLLLDVHGDKKVLERYRDARQNYHAANMEISQLGARLAEEQARLVVAQRKAEAFQRYEKLSAEKREMLATVMPQAEYRSARESIEDAELIIQDGKGQLGPIDREILDVQAQLANADAALDARKRAIITAREEKDEIGRDERNKDIRLNTLVLERRRLDEARAASADIKPEPLEPLREKLVEARRTVARFEIELETIRQELLSREHELSGISGEQPAKIYPHYVNDFTRLLDDNDIEHDLLCDVTEILDTSWQLAIESLIGGNRFLVLVGKRDQQRARELAEKARYRAYIVDRDKQPPVPSGTPPGDSAAAHVRFDIDRVPEWVTDTLRRTALVEDVKSGMKGSRNATSVTRQGYRQDRRGGISIAVDRFYCGSLGQTAQADSARHDVDRLRSRVGQIKKSRDQAEQQAQDFERRIKIQQALLQAENVDERYDELSREIRSANDEHKFAVKIKVEAERKLLETVETLNNFEHDTTDRRRWLKERLEEQSDLARELQDCQKSIEKNRKVLHDIRLRLDTSLLTDAALEEVPTVDELTPRLYAIDTMLNEYEEPPEDTSVHVFEQHRAQFERQRELYQDHEDGLRNWETEYRLAREKYVVVVEHTIREYRRCIMSLAERAGVFAEVIVPNLREQTDLEDAELNVRFGFDGKRAVDVAGATHSGGQRVVASLVLLMSLATSGGNSNGGFFIIDEPFAHLSIERIDDVSDFLSRTESQFILTSPTTHNVNVFDAARLQLNFRIKKPDAKFAPVPTIIRR